MLCSGFFKKTRKFGLVLFLASFRSFSAMLRRVLPCATEDRSITKVVLFGRLSAVTVSSVRSMALAAMPPSVTILPPSSVLSQSPTERPQLAKKRRSHTPLYVEGEYGNRCGGAARPLSSNEGTRRQYGGIGIGGKTQWRENKGSMERRYTKDILKESLDRGAV